MWKNIVERGQATDDSIIRRMRFAFWIRKATNTHSEYVILIAFSLQQWLHERASVLRYTYIGCIVLPLFSDSAFIETNNFSAVAFC